MLEILQYGFILRGLEAGIIIGIIAPFIGIFLVLRRYSLIADTLAHGSLAGVAIGLITKINPLITAVITTLAASIIIEKLRVSKVIYGESALALFLSGSLAVAVVLLGLGHGFGVDLFSYLFGSITTVKQSDVFVIAGLGVFVIVLLLLFYKELVFISFDEETARASGIPTNFINTLFILLSALTVAIAMPIVGILLISALIVIPVITALQFKKSFIKTILICEGFSLTSIILGIFTSYYLDLATGGTIVLINLFFFLAIVAGQKLSKIF